MNRSRFAIAITALCAWLAVAGGCALPYSLKAGDGVDDVRGRLGAPSYEHTTPDGGRYLLYPVGRQTYLLAFDAQGRLVRWENVLDKAHFAEIAPGMTREQVLQQLGEPTEIWGVRYHQQTVWTYRFVSPFCLQFDIGLTPAGIVEDTRYGPDRRCERGGQIR
jgi:hypothetical protein